VVDTQTRKEEEIRARIFAVCCATIETPRLLLNSRSPLFPNGLANSSGCVGRYLHGNVTAGVFGYLEALAGTKPVNNDGAMDHAYIPRFDIGTRKNRDIIGGYQYELQDFGFMFPYQARYLKGFGQKFKEQVRFLQPGFVGMDCYAKALARPENRVTVDPNRCDPYGIPLPVVHFRFCENDVALWKEMREKAREILENAGCRAIFEDSGRPSGFSSHEVGTVRMGSNPRTSVLNGHNQAHDVRNLFVVDGSSFTTYCEKNPTLTIMALAVRAAEYMTNQVRKRNL
jgi:choline dehydrogenase-like flavoprotein